MITIGGGSSMDTATAIGIIITNPEFEDVLSLEGESPTKNPCVPTIAVATTAGTAISLISANTYRNFFSNSPESGFSASVDPQTIIDIGTVASPTISSVSCRKPVYLN